jgi:predicted phosphodiesterase
VLVALLSDVHANLVALDAILSRVQEAGAEAIWHTGDLVGYGPDPDGVVNRLRELGAVCVLGNHDAAVAGLIDVEGFNPLAAAASRWTAETASEESIRFLASLPEVDSDERHTRVHGTLREPLWEYLTTTAAARAHFSLQETRVSIVGHTHLPLAIRETGEGKIVAVTPADGQSLELNDERWCLNPGGAGQPRDGDPRACWALLDTGARVITFHRVDYDIAETQRRMRAAGLPERLAARLSLGR